MPALKQRLVALPNFRPLMTALGLREGPATPGDYIVNVFELDRALVSDYERFARSFTQFRALDIHEKVEKISASNRSGPNRWSVSIHILSIGRRSPIGWLMAPSIPRRHPYSVPLLDSNKLIAIREP
jgi:hypothetical protein